MGEMEIEREGRKRLRERGKREGEDSEVEKGGEVGEEEQDEEEEDDDDKGDRSYECYGPLQGQFKQTISNSLKVDVFAVCSAPNSVDC